MTFTRFISQFAWAFGFFLAASVGFAETSAQFNAQNGAPATQDTPGQLPAELKDVGMTEHLGSRISLESLRFRDEAGKPVVLADYFKSGRPVLLALVYYNCPNLCNFVLNGLVTSLRSMDWVPGKQFDVVAVSVDPRERPEDAAHKKATYLASYRKPETAPGWHFLTADPTQSVAAARQSEPPTNGAVTQLAHEVGFGYRWMGDQYAHSSAIYVLTPEGRISHYLYGIEFPEASLRLSLLEASNGKIGSIMDRVVLFCYHYDPQTRKYSPYVMHLMQAGGGMTVLVMGLSFLIFWSGERRRQLKGVSS
ncbi:MAG: SCO family protein [Oligoflexia bacterium]|nr:SCO family protein [Oligoflexia bacterium]